VRWFVIKGVARKGYAMNVGLNVGLNVGRVPQSRQQAVPEAAGEREELLEKLVSQHFICPITRELMMDPVIDKEGHSFEKIAINRWLRRKLICPIGGHRLTAEDLVDNRALKGAIECVMPHINTKAYCRPSVGVGDEAFLYDTLGNMYAGSNEWLRLGITVDKVPTVSEEMKVALKNMLANGEAPLVVLDTGIGLLELHKILECKAAEGRIPSNAKLRFDHDDRKNAFEKREGFTTGGGLLQYLVVGTGKGRSGTGVLDSTRCKVYEDQQNELKKRYAGYEEMRVREVVVMAILCQLANRKQLLSEESRQIQGLGGRVCPTWARTSEIWTTSGWRVTVGAHGERGLFIYNFHYDENEFDILGLAACRKFFDQP
jgi:hypothetical protein